MKDREESTNDTVDNVLELFNEKLGLKIGKEDIDIFNILEVGFTLVHDCQSLADDYEHVGFGHGLGRPV